MPANLPQPRKFADIVGDMAAVAAAFALLNQLQNLRVYVRQADGSITSHAIQLSGGNAVIDLTQGTFAVAAPPAALTPIAPDENNAKPKPAVLLSGDSL
jgi:hypothetical protein